MSNPVHEALNIQTQVEAAPSKLPFQQTVKEMRRSSVQFYSKQHHTTSLLGLCNSVWFEISGKLRNREGWWDQVGEKCL